MSRFVVNVADLLHRRGARRHERLTGALAGLRVLGSEVPSGREVVVDVELESVSEGILAVGSVSAEWQAECRRCLGPVTGVARAELSDLFELHHREGETYPLRHQRVDFEPIAREVMLLELPLAPLCRADCAGLCPTCGADLNQGGCQCAPAGRDPRW